MVKLLLTSNEESEVEQKRSELTAHSAMTMQTAWRGYYMYVSCQCNLHNIIIVQHFVRCLAARKAIEQKRCELLGQSAMIIQAAWRVCFACSIYQV